MFAQGILHPPVTARDRWPRIRFGPCCESLPPKEGLCREPGAGRVENSTIDTVKDDRTRNVRRTYRATDAGM